MNNKTAQIAFRKIFTDSNGKIVIWQTPNLPLIGWFVFMILSKLSDSGGLKADASYLSSVCLIAWSTLEIAYGDSIFRRLLGAIVLTWTVLTHI